MDKAKVIKAMELCADLQCAHGCAGCPYEGTDQCDKHMLEDAIKLIKANDAPNVTYPIAYVFTKHTSLMPYIMAKIGSQYHGLSNDRKDEIRRTFGKEREVSLVAKFRWDKGRYFCKIKCPVSPLPVKGEFEIPNVSVLWRFMEENGWEFQQKIYANMFQ